MPPVSFGTRYTNLQQIGAGGFGVVYRARDTRLDIDVAIKLLNPQFASSPDWQKRFRQEAMAAARLSHPNITRVYDRSEDEEKLYIVMEFVEGQPLSSFVEKRTPLTDVERLLLLEQLCDGLHYAHQRHIVHRDIKPVNLMVCEEQEGSHTSRTLKILDFGIAKIVNADQTLSDGQLLCTPNYVSPEQIRGASVDRRSDMFAVGAVAYELLVLEKAFSFSAKNMYGLMDEMRRKIVDEPHKPLTDLRPDLDPELVAIVHCALAKDPQNRYDSLAEMGRDLRTVRMRIETANGPAGSIDKTVVLNPRLQETMSRARQCLIDDQTTVAIALLEPAFVFAPTEPVRQMVGELLRTAQAQGASAAERKARREQAAGAAMRAASETFQQGDADAAIRMLERFEPRALVMDHLAALKDAALFLAEIERVIGAGGHLERESALRRLDAFTPAALVASAALRLRARAAERSAEEERARVAAALSIVRARTKFSAGRRGEAIAALSAFAPRQLVAAALDELRAGADAVDRARQIVEAEPGDARERALSELALFTPRELIDGALGELRSAAAARDEEERQAADAVAGARAEAAITSARATFHQGRRDDAIATLEAFDDRPRVAPAVAALREAAQAIDSAAAMVGSGDRAARRRALDQLAESPDLELVQPILEDLQRVDAERRALEDHDAAAFDLVYAAGDQFDSGDHSGAVARLEQFAPAHPVVTAELARLRQLALEVARVERETAQARDLIAQAFAAFREGRRAEALASLGTNLGLPLVASALSDLRRAESVVTAAERAGADGDRAARSAALEQLTRFEPSGLVQGALDAFRRQVARRDQNEREIELAQEEAAWHEAARVAVPRAQDAFARGDRVTACDELRAFGRPELVAEQLGELARLDRLIAGVDQKVRNGTAVERRAALDLLRTAQPATLVKTALSALRRIDRERTSEERAGLEKDRASRAIEKAQSDFDSGRHQEAISALEQYSPATPAVAAALEMLRARRKTIEDDAARAKLESAAAAGRSRARTLFIAGEIADALAVLSTFPRPELVAPELDVLQRAAATIERVQATVSGGTAPERRAALDELAWEAPPELFQRVLADLRRLDEERAAQEGRLAAEQIHAEAELVAASARETFANGNYPSAIHALEQFPQPALVEATLGELREALRAIETARAGVEGADDAVRARSLESLRAFSPSELVAAAAARLEDELLRRRAIDAAARAALEHDRRAALIVERARKAFDTGRNDIATGLLKDFNPAHPVVTQALEEMRLAIRARELVARAEQDLSEGRLADAMTAAIEASRLRPGDHAIEALVQRIDSRERDVRRQRLQSLAKRLALPVGAAALIAVGGVVFWATRQEVPSRPVVTDRPTGPSTSTVPFTGTVAPEPPLLPPAGTGGEPAKEPPPAPTPAEVAAALEQQLGTLRADARTAFMNRRLDAADAILSQALRLKADDPESLRMKNAVPQIRAAATATDKARQGAIDAGAPTRAARSYGSGARREQTAYGGGPSPVAVTNLAAARDLYVTATNEAKAAEAKEKPTALGQVVTPLPPDKPVELPVKPPEPVVAKETAEEQARRNAQDQARREDEDRLKRTPPPPAAPSDEDRIRQVLEKYVAAYQRKDAAAVGLLQPAVSQAQLGKAFNDLQSYDMAITNQKISINGNTAVVSCTISTRYRPKLGNTESNNRAATLRLQKTGDSWVIVDRR